MRDLIHVSLGDELVSLHMIAEVAVSKEDPLHRRHIGTREQVVTRFAKTTATKVPNICREDCDGFVALLGRHAGNINRRLKYRVVLKGLQQDLTGVGDVQKAFHLYRDLQHSIIRDLEPWNLREVQSVRR